MTVAQESNPIFLAGDGVTTDFSFPWYLLATDHLAVHVIDASGVVSTPALGVDITVAPAPPATGGTVTFLPHAIPASGETVMLARVLPVHQPTILSTATTLSLPTIERALDRIVMELDTLHEALSRRPAFRLASLNAIRDMELPQPEALKLLQYNATADGLSLVDAALATATPDPTSQLVYTQDAVAVTPDSGDVMHAASAFVPAGIILLGVVACVATELGNGNSLTTWSLGTLDEPQRWGSGLNRAATTQSNVGQHVAYRPEPLPSALDVYLSSDAGSFDGTGSVILTYSGFSITPKTSV